jgi:hypothetical protein
VLRLAPLREERPFDGAPISVQPSFDQGCRSDQVETTDVSGIVGEQHPVVRDPRWNYRDRMHVSVRQRALVKFRSARERPEPSGTANITSYSKIPPEDALWGLEATSRSVFRQLADAASGAALRCGPGCYRV